MLKIEQLLKRSSQEQNDSAAFERPLDLLSSCHEKILHFSSALLKLSTTLKCEGWSGNLVTSAEQISRYFNIAGPEHHKDEEMHLFPAIIALDPEFTKPETAELVQLINRLIKEHVESDVLWASLNSMLQEKTEDFANLYRLAGQFEAEMRRHVIIENEQIFPFAKAHISATEFKKMGAAIAQRRGIKQLKPV
ncbi:MAG: hemerythrin domain-containing protein [Gammaproteobacteria bacterium]|nr:hemerythrin domain-containing protein [Gammaproteobacteria bacterium]